MDRGVFVWFFPGELKLLSQSHRALGRELTHGEHFSQRSLHSAPSQPGRVRCEEVIFSWKEQCEQKPSCIAFRGPAMGLPSRDQGSCCPTDSMAWDVVISQCMPQQMARSGVPDKAGDRLRPLPRAHCVPTSNDSQWLCRRVPQM